MRLSVVTMIKRVTRDGSMFMSCYRQVSTRKLWKMFTQAFHIQKVRTN